MKKFEILGKQYSCKGKAYYILWKDFKSGDFIPPKLILKEFTRYFTDHPDGKNTRMFYLEDWPFNRVVFACAHFEHDDISEVAHLIGFMEFLRTVFSADEVHLALLDLFAEHLIIELYSTKENEAFNEYVNALKSFGAMRPFSGRKWCPPNFYIIKISLK